MAPEREGQALGLSTRSWCLCRCPAPRPAPRPQGRRRARTQVAAAACGVRGVHRVPAQLREGAVGLGRRAPCSQLGPRALAPLSEFAS